MLASALWILLMGFFADQKIARRLVTPPLIGMILVWIILEPQVSEEIIRAAQHYQVTDIVMGKRVHQPWAQVSVGSVSQAVLEASPIPVILVKDRQKQLIPFRYVDATFDPPQPPLKRGEQENDSLHRLREMVSL